LAGADAEPRFQGQSFVRLIEDGESTKRIGYASLLDEERSIRTAKTIETKYIHDVAEHARAWYDLVTDPGEQHPSPTPVAGSEALAPHTTMMAMRGAEGLHLLITTSSDQTREVTGTVDAARVAQHELDFYDWKSESSATDKQVAFEIRTKDEMDSQFDRERWHNTIAEQESAHLHVKLEGPARVRLEVDGDPIDPGIVSFGKDGSHGPLDGAELDLNALIADPDSFDPAGLPRQFGVYVWYVAAVDVVPLEELDAATRETLEALGYVD